MRDRVQSPTHPTARRHAPNHQHRERSCAPPPPLALALALALAAACSEPASTGSDAITLPLGDATGADTTGADTTGTDTSDTSTADSSANDAASADAAATDTIATDTAIDVTEPDVTEPDVSEPDVGEPDVEPTDIAIIDAADTAIADAADTAVADTAVADTTPDVAPADTTADTTTDTAADATADTGGPTATPFALLPCKKMTNTNTDGTVNPFIAPARDGQFYVSWVQKGNNLMLTWEAPNSCKTIEGPLQVNKTAGEVYYWGGIAVFSDKAGNFYAVWESNTKGAEISFAWSKTGKDFSAPVELVSTSTNGQDPALWVPQPGVVHAAWRGHHPTKKQYDPLYARADNAFANTPFTAGVLVHDDAPQDDQVAIVGDSKGNLFVGWQSFDGDIFVAKSADQGKTWTAPVQVNDVKGKANVGKARFMVITPDDRLVMMWSDDRKQKSGNENDVFADSSADGQSWCVDVQVNDDDARYQEDPSMAVGITGPCKGAVYAVWQDFRGKKSYDIYLSRSLDGGKSWGQNQAVAADLEGDEMNPAIAVDTSCVVGVAWRDGTKNQSFHIGTQYLTY